MLTEELFHKGRLGSSTRSGEQEPIEDYGSYAVIRSARDRTPMLQLQKRDGEILAVPYTMIERVLFRPDIGVTIVLMGSEITIKGRYLNSADGSKMGLFNALCRHRIAWVRENPRAIGIDAQAAVIESIMW